MKISEVKAVLLGMLVFLLVLGSWFVYRQINRTDVLKSDEILIPTDDGEWTRSIFFIEEPTKNLDVYIIKNDNKLLPDLYQDSISNINPDVQTYINIRNTCIKEFEKKFCVSAQHEKTAEKSILLKPFDALELIEEILPFSKNGKNMILVIGREPNDIYFSKFYLLDDNFKLLHQLNDTKYNGSCLVTGKFLDRIWIQNRSTAAVSYSLSINQIDVDNKHLKMNQIYWESEYEVDGVFNTFKVINASTNPKLAVYDKGKSDFWFFVFVLVAMAIVDVGSIILGSPIFPYILGLIILLYFLYRFRKQILQYLRSLRKKHDNI